MGKRCLRKAGEAAYAVTGSLSYALLAVPAVVGLELAVRSPILVKIPCELARGAVRGVRRKVTDLIDEKLEELDFLVNVM